ncbi:PREDICTED: HAUS augmin-like complex subunit 6, partial [Leptosomus discolor]|uniref:HAUS augmin-like complex subunit 6 n=1 Tax=Leptosomus discolor TaxID=188344 RepID=UPI0005226B48
TEIRTSWRKATQTEGLSDIEVDLTEVMTERAPMDARPVVQKTADSRFTCSISSFPAPDFDPPLSERKSRLSSTEFRPQEQMKISHIVESPVLETSGMRESERTEARELKCIVLNKSSVEDPGEQTSQYVKKSLGTPNICSENDSRTNVLHSNQFWGSVMGEMLHCNVSSLLSSVSCEAGHLGILDETFPEEHGNIDPNKSASSESDFGVIDSAYVKGDSKNKGDIKKSKLDLQSQFNTGKALKKPASSSEEKVHQTCNGDESVSCKSDLSLVPGKRESAESWNCPHLFCLDEEFTNMPLPKSLDERKYSLSSLLVFSQHLEEMASAVHEIPLNLPDRLK